jgi:hypothetical protein
MITSERSAYCSLTSEFPPPPWTLIGSNHPPDDLQREGRPALVLADEVGPHLRDDHRREVGLAGHQRWHC